MLRFPIERSLRYRVAVALATFSIFIVGTLCIILYFASDNIEEDHIKQVIEMEMDHLVHRYQKHSDFISQVGSRAKNNKACICSPIRVAPASIIFIR